MQWPPHPCDPIAPALGPERGLKPARIDMTGLGLGHRSGPRTGARIETATSCRRRSSRTIAPALGPERGLKRYRPNAGRRTFAIAPALGPERGLKPIGTSLVGEHVNRSGPRTGARIETSTPRCVGRTAVDRSGPRTGARIETSTRSEDLVKGLIAPALGPERGLKHSGCPCRPPDHQIAPALGPERGLKPRRRPKPPAWP